MSTLDIKKLYDRSGTGSPNFTNGLNISGSDSGLLAFSHYNQADEPTYPANGDSWWDTTNEHYKVYVNDTWLTVLGTAAVAGIAWGGDRGVIGGGLTNDLNNTIAYFDITTTGNATDFGDLTVARQALGGLSNTTRGVFAGGGGTNVIDYITIATPSNATDFGDLLGNAFYAVGTCDGSRGVIWRQSSDLDYISVDTTGNSAQFGTMPGGAYNAGWNDSTRAIFARGSNGNTMYYVTIQTTGDATTFGNLTAGRQRFAGCGDGTYAIFGGGENNPPATGNSNVLDYVTIQTTGNATDFGDLLSATQRPAATSNGTRGCWAGGEVGSNINVIQYITITSPGNATDFGDLTDAVGFAAGLSGSAA
jgi:hypothetical protein